MTAAAGGPGRTALSRHGLRPLVDELVRRLTEGTSVTVAVPAARVEFVFGPIAEDPRRVGAPLRKPFAGQWRARRGEYRVRYRIDDETRTVYVLDIDHHHDASAVSRVDG